VFTSNLVNRANTPDLEAAIYPPEKPALAAGNVDVAGGSFAHVKFTGAGSVLIG
jgi:hypothetical protein